MFKYRKGYIMGKIITISNQKGGVGKTATTSALAYGLKERGYKVLVVDADGQCNTSDAFKAKIENEVTLYDLLKKEAPINEAIQHTEYIDIIAGDYLLKQADRIFTDVGREYLLKEALQPIVQNYDYIVIDTIPALGVMLSNALTAADYVVIPMGADRDSLQGLAQLSAVINQVRQYANSNLKIAGLLITRANKQANIVKSMSTILPGIEESLNVKTFNTKIRENIHVQDARASFMPIIEFKKQNKDKKVIAVEDYNIFIEELLQVMENSGNG